MGRIAAGRAGQACAYSSGAIGSVNIHPLNRRYASGAVLQVIQRLNSIKLAGFVTAAEPTNFQPRAAGGRGGPNGCGKSNIMDAVRCAGRV